MKKEKLKAFEYGAAKNGATIYFLPEINCLLSEWTGDILANELMEILSYAQKEIAERKITNWIGDASRAGMMSSDELAEWSQNVWTPKVIEAGLKKMAVVLPDDILGEMAIEESMEDMKEKVTESDLQIFHTKSIDDAIAWIKA